MDSVNQGPHGDIDLNEVVHDIMNSLEDSDTNTNVISHSNSNSEEDIPLDFDLNVEIPGIEELSNVNTVNINDGSSEDGVRTGCSKEQEIVNSTPTEGMFFECGEDFARFCHKYAYEKGFQFFVRSSKLMKEYREEGVNRLGVGDKEPKNHMMSRIRLVCKMGTKDKRKNFTGRKISSPPPGCKVYVDARVTEGGLVITKCELTHNHDLFPECSRLMVNYRCIDDGAFKQMALNDSAGISLTKSYNSMVIGKGGQQNLTFSQRDLRNAVNVNRRRIIFGGDADVVEQHFERMSEANPEFFSAIQTDEEGKLVNVFWADARCKAQYKDFGDVVSFDTTFLCNRYQMPFAPFVGCNHHGSSIMFGAALISHEDADSFVWVFQQWLKCMGQPPKGIITDQCKAIGKAVQIVFPEVPHRLCLWHILQNANRNLGKLEKFKDIQKDLKIVVHDSLSIEEFEDAWKWLVAKYSLEDNNWINDTFDNRHRWAPGFWRDTFWAGMSSTQRSEGQNRVVKGYVSLNTGLMQFMNQFEESIKKKVEEEKELNYLSHSKPCGYDNSILVEAIYNKAYTNKKFLEVRDEVIGLKHTNVVRTGEDGSKVFYDADEKIPIPLWKARHKIFKVSVDKENGEYCCSCKLFEFCGILCRHIICSIEAADIDYIPAKYIVDRWRKNIVRGYEGIHLSYYDPNESLKIKKHNEISVRHQYLSTLALHNDETLQMYKEATDKIRTTLEEVIGIRSTVGVNGLDWSDPATNRVFGRRRLRPKENNQEHLQRSAKPTEERNIKDPVDKRGVGRAQSNRSKHPAEKNCRKRKKKDDQGADDEDGEAMAFDQANMLFGDASSYYGVPPNQFYNGNFSSGYGPFRYGPYDHRMFPNPMVGFNQSQSVPPYQPRMTTPGMPFDRRVDASTSQPSSQYQLSQHSNINQQIRPMFMHG